jgi:hypothetical protein
VGRRLEQRAGQMSGKERACCGCWEGCMRLLGIPPRVGQEGPGSEPNAESSVSEQDPS